MKKFTSDELETITDLYLSGISLTKIGDSFGVSKTKIKRVVSDLGIYNPDRKSISVDEHKRRLDRHGKVRLVGEWLGTQTKTLYFCIEHEEEHLAYPNNVMKGHGLICCKKAGEVRTRNKRVQEKSDSYDERIKKITGGSIVRVGKYILSTVPILHYCKVHKEEHLSRPHNILCGFGLSCCRRAWSIDQGVNRNKRAKNDYDINLKLRSDNRFTRIEEYIDARTPILHYCSIHDEEHLAIPNKLLSGDGMKCCNTGVGWDTLENLLEHKETLTDVEEPCQFYIFQVPNTVDCVKVGIAKNSWRRSQHGGSRDIYGELISAWQCSSRRNAILIETSILRDSSFEYPSKFLSGLEFKQGHTEVRRLDIDKLVDHVQVLFESLEEGENCWADWALENIPSLRKWEQTSLRGLVGEVSDSDG